MEVNKLSYSEVSLVDNHVDPSISPKFMGMGSCLTWRGTLDGRADFAPVSIVQRSCLEDRSDSESEQSTGGKTVYEAKQDLGGKDVDQLVAQVVVSPFIHKKRHKEQNTLTPAVGLSMLDGSLVAAMYDSKLDILFTSDQVQWLDMDKQGLSVQGVVFLWLLLHHHLFLRELADCKDQLVQAGLHKIFRNARALQAYETLDSYALIRWPQHDWKKQLATAEVISLDPASKRPRKS